MSEPVRASTGTGAGPAAPAAVASLADRVAAEPRSIVLAFLGSIWPLVVGLAIAFAMQVVIAPLVGDYKARILLEIGTAIVLAVSLNIVNGFAGQFSIGHAGFMLVGGYVAATVTYYGSLKLWGSVTPHGGFLGTGDMLFLLACLLGGVVAALAGLAVGLPSLRLRGDYLAIVTLGFGEIMRVLVQLSGDVLYKEQLSGHGWLSLLTHVGGSTGFSPRPPSYVSPTPWKAATGHAGVFYVYVFAAIVCIVAYRLKYSSKGRALLAVRENEIAAEAMGVDTSRVKVSAFVLAAFFGGIGGALFAHEFGVTLRPSDLGFVRSIDIVIIVVLGGMGSVSGVVLAAAFLTILPEAFREFAQYRMVIYALALILTMILRPQGLMGLREIWELGWWRRSIGRGWAWLRHRMPSAGQAALVSASVRPRRTGMALEVSKVSIAFGGLKAVSELSLALPARALYGLIGPNGAGKTTAFNLLTGVYKAQSGTITLLGKRVNGLRPSAIARVGMARTFQNIRLFGELSVLDNVRTAAGVRARSGLFRSLERTPLYLAEERAILARSLDLLNVLGLSHRTYEIAKDLPYGDQRRLEIARALATEPEVLLLDEPVAGMNSGEKREMATLIQSLRERFDVAILLIEHDMGLVMEICEHITVLDHGVVIAAGAPAKVQSDPKVIEAYLGVPDDEAESPARGEAVADVDDPEASVAGAATAQKPEVSG